MKNKPLKILSLIVDRGGCGWYRVRQPFNMINEHTTSEAHVMDKDDDPIGMLEALWQSDILLVRQGAEVGIDAIRNSVNEYAHEMKYNRGFKAKIVIDIDDNVEMISPYSQHYKEYGLNEFYDTQNKQHIWKNGQ